MSPDGCHKRASLPFKKLKLTFFPTSLTMIALFHCSLASLISCLVTRTTRHRGSTSHPQVPHHSRYPSSPLLPPYRSLSCRENHRPPHLHPCHLCQRQCPCMRWVFSPAMHARRPFLTLKVLQRRRSISSGEAPSPSLPTDLETLAELMLSLFAKIIIYLKIICFSMLDSLIIEL